MPRSRAVRAAAVVSVVLIAAIGWYLGAPLFIRTSADEAIPTVSATPTAATAATLPPLGATPPSQTDSGPTLIARGELQFVDSLPNGKGPGVLRRVGGDKLRAKTRQVRLQPLRIRIALLGPAGAEERLPLDDLARASGEGREQSELRRREVEGLVLHRSAMCARVDGEASDERGRVAACGSGRATEQRADTRRELLLAEGLF